MNIIYYFVFLFISQFSFDFNHALELLPLCSPLPDSQQVQKKENAGAANPVFRSSDGGQTWQDISEGLPAPVTDKYGVSRNVFFEDDNGLHLSAGDGIYHSEPNAPSYWKKDIFPEKMTSMTPGKNGILAYNHGGEILQKTTGTSIWSPYANFPGSILTVFEAVNGNVFIGNETGVFKSGNAGKTWHRVHGGGWVIKLAESDGVLLATSESGIIRSNDGGENWTLVINEGGVGIDVASIAGGFAAISFNTQSNTRRVRTSYDGGKTWQAIDAGLQEQNFIAPTLQSRKTGLPPQAFISSIIQVGESFFCGHPDGVFRSSDKGKTWKLLLPSIEGKVFNLYVSGKVIYALPKNGGC